MCVLKDKVLLTIVFMDDVVSKRDEVKEENEQTLQHSMQRKGTWCYGKTVVYINQDVREVHMQGSSYI